MFSEDCMFNGNLSHFVSKRWQSDSAFSLSYVKKKSVRVQIIIFFKFPEKMHGALKTCLIYKQRGNLIELEKLDTKRKPNNERKVFVVRASF